MLLQRSRVMVGVVALFVVLSGLVGLLQFRGATFLPTRVVPAASEEPAVSAVDRVAALEEKCQARRKGCELQCGYWSPKYQLQHCFPECAQAHDACVAGALVPDNELDSVAAEQLLAEEEVPVADEAPLLPEAE